MSYESMRPILSFRVNVTKANGHYVAHTLDTWDRTTADWFHLTFIINPTDPIKLYINGKLNMIPVQYATLDNTAHGNNPAATILVLGMWAQTEASAIYGTFEIDDLKVWNKKEFSDAQIEYLYYFS